MLALEIIEGPDRGRHFPMPSHEPQLIGRSSESFPLTDGSVSRRHAELTPDGTHWLIRDLDSSHGTQVNGASIQGRIQIASGDEIRCGRTLMKVIELDAPVAGPAQSQWLHPPQSPPITDPMVAIQTLDMLWSLIHASSMGHIPDAASFDAHIATHTHGDQSEHQDERDDAPRWPHSVTLLATWLQRTITTAQSAGDRERLAAMGETIAIVSHAVKNILQGLQGGAGAIEMAIQRGDLELAKQGWPILSRNLDRIHDLTFNMLAWSRASHLDIQLQPLQPLIEEICALQAPVFAQKRVELVCVPANLPPIPFDSAALHQSILNLVLNALEAVPARHGRVQIGFDMNPGGDEVCIVVSDNGPGIPQAAQDSIFEPFTSTRGQRGTGLGLAVTRSLIEAHGGTLVLASTAHDGAEFHIRLPLDAPHVDLGETDVPPAATFNREDYEP